MSQTPPIVDTTLFHREEKLFRARLQYLAPVVDCFVVVEATTDHSGKSNEPRLPALFDADPDFYNQFPIRHVVASLPTGTNNWPRVWAHRNAVLEGLNWSEAKYEIPNEA